MAENNDIYTPPTVTTGTANFGSVSQISNDEIQEHNIQNLADRPNAAQQYGGNAYSAKDLKERFEGLAMLAINAINGLIRVLGSANVSENIQIPDWGGDQTLKALVEAVQDGTLAQAIKVATVEEAGYGDGDENPKEEFSTLQDVLTYLTNYVSALDTAKGKGELAKEIVVDTVTPEYKLVEFEQISKGEAEDLPTLKAISNLQDVLKYITDWLKDFQDSNINDLLPRCIYMRSIFPNIAHPDFKPAALKPEDLSKKEFEGDKLANAFGGVRKCIESLYYFITTKGVAEKIPVSYRDIQPTTLQKALEAIGDSINLLEVFKNNHPATVYTPGGSVKALPDPTSIEYITGIVLSVDTEGGVDYSYNGKDYPSGTNFALIAPPNSDGFSDRYWDAIGGIVDYANMAESIKVPEYSGKDTLAEVIESFADDIDRLEKEWDLIITDPTDLATKLATATGNVLVKLSQPYENLHYIQFNEGLKLIDFGGSYFRFTYFTANPEAKTVIKNIKTVITQEELWEGLGNGTLKNFGAVENCRGVLEYVNCSSIENCDIKYAESCNYIRNCSVPYSEYTTSAVFKDCCFINNVDVSNSEPVQNIEVHFDNCHHISNIHDDGAEHPDYPTLVYYDAFCTFVDPYTCAGYVSPDNSGKVPVPDDKGGVEFKTVVPAIRNTQNHNALYVQENEANGGGQYLTLFGPAAYKNYIAQRTKNCQLAAPNQSTPEYEPGLDEYISRRYLENTVGDIATALAIINEGGVSV